MAAGSAKSNDMGEVKDVMICPAVPHAGCIREPAPDTPVAAWYQPSYKVYLHLKAAAHGGTHHTMSDMPDWSGLWLRRHTPAGFAFDPKQVGKMSDGQATADLTPQGMETYKRKLAMVAKGLEWDPITYCLPSTFPRILAGGFQYEWVDLPKETWGLYEPKSEVRRIYTDGRGHVPEDESYPLWDGDSIGFWDGDTLVIHTINVVASEFQRSQPDYSKKTSILEQLRRSRPNTLEDDVIIWDPVNLAEPWHVVQHYDREMVPHERIDMWSCSANNNTVKAANGSTHIILPGEPGYVNPDKLTQDPAAVRAPAGH